MSAYDAGTVVRIKTALTDLAGTPADATVTVKVTRDGTTVFDAAASHEGAVGSGLYFADIATTVAGIYLSRWVATGAIATVKTDQFTAVAQRALVSSVAEARAQVNRSDAKEDPEIREYLEAATDYVTWAVGPPGVIAGVQEDVVLRNGFALLTGKAVREITAVEKIEDSWSTEVSDPLPVADYRMRTVSCVDQVFGMAVDVKNGCGLHRITYRHGYAVLPYSIKLAGLMIMQHLWLTQGGMARGDFSNVMEETRIPGAPFAIPLRAQELLKPYMPPEDVVW